MKLFIFFFKIIKKGGIEGKEAAGAEGGVAGREIGIGAALGGVAAG